MHGFRRGSASAPSRSCSCWGRLRLPVRRPPPPTTGRRPARRGATRPPGDLDDRRRDLGARGTGRNARRQKRVDRGGDRVPDGATEAGLERGSGQTGDGPPHWYETAAQASTRSSFIVDPPDGRIPYTGAGRREWDNRNLGSFKEGPFDGPEDLDLRDRCITRGLPNTYFPSAYNNGFQIVQHPDHVAILYERLHEHRLIPIDGRPHLDASVRQWFGDSRGRWEGDTLVVETTNYTAR